MEAGQLGLKSERTERRGESDGRQFGTAGNRGRATGKKNGLNTRARYQIANVSVPISDADDATLSMSCWTYN